MTLEQTKFYKIMPVKLKLKFGLWWQDGIRVEIYRTEKQRQECIALEEESLLLNS